MDRVGINQQSLAPKAGMSVGHLSEVRRGLVTPTLTLLNDLAFALGLEAWELLADTETTRQNALAKLLWQGGVPNEKVEQHLPPAPKSDPAPRKQLATRKRRKSPKKKEAKPNKESPE